MSSVPGLNLYKLATKVIKPQAFTWFEFDSRTEDSRGFDITAYKDGVPKTASIQAVPRNLFQSIGLDFQKYYVMLYTDDPDLNVVDRDTSGDQIEFNGQCYQLLSNTDWNPQDNWEGVLAVRLANEVSP